MLRNLKAFVYGSPMVLAALVYWPLSMGMIPQEVQWAAKLAPVWGFMITAWWTYSSRTDSPFEDVMRAGLTAMIINFAIGSVFWFLADPPRYGPIPTGTYGDLGGAFIGAAIVGAFAVIVFGLVISLACGSAEEAGRD